MSASATALVLMKRSAPARSTVSASPREVWASRPGWSERVVRELSIAKASKPLSCSDQSAARSARHAPCCALASRSRSKRSSRPLVSSRPSVMLRREPSLRKPCATARQAAPSSPSAPPATAPSARVPKPPPVASRRSIGVGAAALDRRLMRPASALAPSVVPCGPRSTSTCARSSSCPGMPTPEKSMPSIRKPTELLGAPCHWSVSPMPRNWK